MSEHAVLRHPLTNLFQNTGARSARASSWDRTGGNHDWITIEPGETALLLAHDGAGCVNHFYCTMIDDVGGFRDGILRCFWDGEDTPSVEVPIGDFFGLAHGRIREFQSALVAVNSGIAGSHGLNSYFPMPFAKGARITLENRGTERLFRGGFWYHIDYDTFDEPPPTSVMRLHAQFRQERPTTAVGRNPNKTHHDAVNVDGNENYVALEALGAGQMVGLLLQINNLGAGWYGEGDDMVFIDGEGWPPSLHGTGTEEVFGGGASPNVEYAGPYSGFHLVESPTFDGLIGMYRWYVHDPIRFTKSLRWTIEHGHANNYANDYTSVVWWYQAEPHGAFPALPSREDVLPLLGPEYEAARALFDPNLGELIFRSGVKTRSAVDAFSRGEWRRALTELERTGFKPSEGAT